MDEKKQIGIAILPPESYSVEVRKKEIYLAKKYNTVRGLLQPPHITIKWPFEVEMIAPFEEYCKRLSMNMKPFAIRVDGYGFFEPKVIFLKVVSSDELNLLHLKIIKELKDQFGIEKNEFEGNPPQEFHTTLAYGDLDQKNFYSAKKELLASEHPQFSFVFDSIALFRFTGEEWIVHRKFKVKK